MTTAYSTLLGLALPVQGELSGTWGDTVDNGITRYLDIAVAGTVTLTNDGAVTLSLTNGDSTATNIVSSLTGAGTTSAQFAIIRVTGTLTVAKVLTAPSSSRTYVVVNAATGSTVTVKASGQTGVSIAVGETAFVYFNGTDYVKIVGTATAGAAGGSTTQVQYNNAGVLAGITGATTNGTSLTLVAPVLGTPASGTVTNLTGTASININGTVGATTATTGAFTTITASSTLTVTGAGSIEGLTVGRGAGAVATNTAVGVSAIGGSNTGTSHTAIGYNALLANTSGTDNTALGRDTLRSNTTASGGVAVGNYALYSNTTGANNMALGINAMYTNTTGSNNTGLGYGSLQNNTTGAGNTAVGYQAGNAITTGSFNVAIGRLSMDNSAGVTGDQNTAVGNGTLRNVTSGTLNTAVGSGALSLTTTGAYNTAVGQSALTTNTASFNTAVGYQAGYTNTSGQTIDAFGYAALYANTTGTLNVAMGAVSLFSNTTGSSNTAVGREALRDNTTASNNTAVGYQAGYLNTTGTFLVAMGYQAGYGNTIGTDNIAIGRQVMQGVGAGSSNVGIGTYALQANTASNNTAVGYQAGYSNTTGGNNSAFGTQALHLNTTASNNTAVGYQAGYSNTTTNGGTFVGYQAGYSLTTGSFNTFVGLQAGYAITTGTRNTILGGYNGNQGGLDIRTASNYIVLSDGDGNPRGIFDGSGNLFVGGTTGSSRLNLQTTTNSATDSSYITLYNAGENVGYIDWINGNGALARINGTKEGSGASANDGILTFSTAFNASLTERARIDSSGNLLVGKLATSATTVGFEVTGSSGAISSTMASAVSAQSTLNVYSTNAAAYRFYVGMDGVVNATNININAISDQRLKENVRDIDTGLDAIMALKPRRFDWKEGKGQDKKNAAGFIAQEFETVFPECVGTSKAGGDGVEYKNINHETLIPTLVKAIQEQQALITSLTARITALEST